MRWYCKVMIVAAVAWAFVEMSTARQPPLGGGGFTGKASPITPSIFQSENVKKELKLTDEQLGKIPDAVMKGLAEVLNEKQMKRLKEINLQLRGARAFSDAAVQKDLKISADQAENIKLILADADKELAALAKDMQKDIEAGNFKNLAIMRDKMNALNKDLRDRVFSVLTADQKRNWQDMIGDDFKLEQPKKGL
jgi:hypothetical protein